MLRSVIFDMDGTLFQTDTILEIALEETFAYLRSQNKWDSETPLEKYREIMGVPLPKVWETLLPHYSRMEREETDTYFLERLTENINSGNGKLYPNVKEVFRYLKENDCNIYIASNGLINYLDAIVNYFDLNHWITETFSIEQIDSLNKSNLVRYIVKKI